MKTARYALALLVIAGFLQVATAVHAQTALNLSIFPAVQEKEITPGEKTRLQIQVRNGDNIAVPGQIKLTDYVVSDNQGTPVLLENTGTTSKYNAAEWIKPGNNLITIPPHDFVTVDLYINPPANMSTCGHYAVVYFQPDLNAFKGGDKTKLNSASAINAKIGGLINLTARNVDCKENMMIGKLNLPKFQEYGPIKAGFEIFNLGDFHITPRGVVSLTNAFGQTVDQKNLADNKIFPEKSRKYEEFLGQKWMFGPYKVLVSASSNGPKNLAKSAFVTVWVMPVRAIIIIVLALALLFILGKKTLDRIHGKEALLEHEVEEEKEEIEKLKEALRKKKE